MSDVWKLESKLLASVDDTPLGKVRLSDMHKLANSLKLRQTFGFDDIPKE
jgi:hypothetical protein